jgi:uncharacterized protein YbaA (DUF1428 family)
MGYVDGFVLPVPTRHLPAYLKLARKSARIWIELGALEYREATGDDLAVAGVVNFPTVAQARKGETVVFAWITYRSRKHRDEVNRKIIADPRIQAMMKLKLPFDPGRMAFGGFRIAVRS